MNKKYIKYILIAALIILGLFIYLFITLNPQRKTAVQTSFQNLFPFGQPQDTTITGTTPDGNIITINPDTGEIIIQNIPKVRQITDFPIAGYQPRVEEVNEQITRTVTQDDGTEVTLSESIRKNVHTVRYAASASSYIYDTIIDETLTTEQLTDGFIPNSQKAVFSADTNTVALQSYSEEQRVIKTYFGSINKIPVVPTACPFTFPTNVAFKDTGEPVANIQRFLNGFLGITISETGENSPGNETGIYDELTRQAIIQFQNNRSITPDGNVGPTTRAQLQAACMEIQTEKAEALFKINNPYAYRLQGIFGLDNSFDLSNAIDNSVMYLNKRMGITTLYTRNMVTNTSLPLYDSPFSEWIPQPIALNKIFLTTKASATVPGFLYELNTTNKTFKKIIGSINGLTTLVSPDGNFILYSSSRGSEIQLHLYNVVSGTGTTLGVTTLPEKCTWNTTSTEIYCAIPDTLPLAQYPDDWYQGTISFTDTLWIINPITGSTNKLIDLREYKNSGINMVNLMISKGDRYLFFKDNTDKTLWVADLFQ